MSTPTFQARVEEWWSKYETGASALAASAERAIEEHEEDEKQGEEKSRLECLIKPVPERVPFTHFLNGTNGLHIERDTLCDADVNAERMHEAYEHAGLSKFAPITAEMDTVPSYVRMHAAAASATRAQEAADELRSCDPDDGDSAELLRTKKNLKDAFDELARTYKNDDEKEMIKSRKQLQQRWMKHDSESYALTIKQMRIYSELMRVRTEQLCLDAEKRAIADEDASATTEREKLEQENFKLFIWETRLVHAGYTPTLDASDGLWDDGGAPANGLAPFNVGVAVVECPKCVICKTRECTIIFAPCMHTCLCAHCWGVWKHDRGARPMCPVCSVHIDSAFMFKV